MQAARILTPMQVAMLREAAETTPVSERTKAIDATVAMIFKQSPEKFYHYTKDGKPDPAMKQRVFYDEPRNLELVEYGGYKLPYAGIDQAKLFKARGAL